MTRDRDNNQRGGEGTTERGEHSSPRMATAAAASPVRGLAPDAPMTATEIGSEETLAATPVGQITSPERPGAKAGASVALATGGRGLEGKRLAERYTILEMLGRGGMSEVYLARHELLQKTVAIKVLREELAASKEALSRFHREAVAAASIGDPHIVDVTDYGFTDEGDAFLVMERLEGRDLRHLLRSEGALPPGRAVAIARQVLRALRAAHERGIVHRDLKAENIFLCERDGADFVKLLDFGISKLQRSAPEGEGGAAALTATGMVMGTPQYISPEQAHGEPDIDQRADIYSMGVILYEMLTGQLPFVGESAFAVMMKHVQEEPEPLHRRRPDLEVPAALEEIVLKAMRKDKAERFSTADAMLEALPRAKALTGGYESLGTGAIPEPKGSAPRWRQWVAVLLLAGLGAGAYAMLKESPDSAPAAAPDQGLPHAAPDLASARDMAPARPDLARAQDQGVELAKPPQVSVLVTALPKNARIYLGKKLLGRGKATIQGPKGTREKLTVKLARHRTATHVLVLDPDRPTPIIRLRALKRRPGKETPGDIKKNPYE